jgi:hypothetical protein
MTIDNALQQQSAARLNRVHCRARQISEPTGSFAGRIANLHNLECLRCSPAGCIVPCWKPDILTTGSRVAAVPVFHPLCRPLPIECPKVQPSRSSRACMSV